MLVSLDAKAALISTKELTLLFFLITLLEEFLFSAKKKVHQVIKESSLRQFWQKNANKKTDLHDQ